MQSWQTSTEMNYDPPILTELTVDKLEGARQVAFTSSTKGNGEDNAVNPDALTDQQKARAVTLNYQYKSCIVITFSVPAMDAEPQSTKYDGTKYDYGRNFLFSGGGGVTYECTRTSPISNDLTSATTGNADATSLLVAGGVAAVALLALLFFASRPSTRAFVKTFVGKPSGSAPTLQSVAVSPRSDDRAVPASAVDAPPGAAGGQGVPLYPKVTDATQSSADTPAASKLPAVYAAQKWLSRAEDAAASCE